MRSRKKKKKPMQGFLTELKKLQYHCDNCGGLPWECTCGRTKADLVQWIKAVGEDLEGSTYATNWTVKITRPLSDRPLSKKDS